MQSDTVQLEAAVALWEAERDIHFGEEGTQSPFCN